MNKNTPIRIKELNEAIIKVLTTQFKKDAKEAHALVESYGYTISKVDGHFIIKNPLTRRYVYITEARSYLYAYDIHINTNDKRVKRSEELNNFDYVNFLEKPLNTAWYKTQYGENEYHPTREKWNRLSSAKWYLEYRTKDIDKIKKQIESLQKDLIRQVEWKEEAKHDLADVRKEYGLTK